MHRCVVLWSLFIVTDQQHNYDEWQNSYLVFDRLLKNMRTYAEETNVRCAEMTKYRATYEKSAHFEMGYIMSEILERYRKMIHSLKSPLNPASRSNSLFINIKRAEYVQKLFLEVYHLVNMMHEINRKYMKMLKQEAAWNGQDADRTSVIDALEQIKFNKKMKERRRKRRKKMLARQKRLQYVLIDFSKKNTTGNKWWPIDYGWEIDYYW